MSFREYLAKSGQVQHPGSRGGHPWWDGREWRYDHASADTTEHRALHAGAREFGDAFTNLPAPAEWSDLRESEAWFSPYHEESGPFELPFSPQQYVYSPVTNVPVRPDRGVYGYYKRGVRKYQTAYQKGKEVPPVTFVYREHQPGQAGFWELADGSHRYEAAVLAGKGTIRAVFAFPRSRLTNKTS